MNNAAEYAPVIRLDVRASACVVPDCGGTIVRHSLGAGMSIDRCTRCFRRYEVRPAEHADAGKGRLRRLVDDFITWRD
jgi:hypothetical protein